MDNNPDKIKKLEKLLQERELILCEKEKILETMKSRIEEQESIEKHLISEIKLLKENNEESLFKARNITDNDERLREMQEAIQEKEIDFINNINHELEKQKELEKNIEFNDEKLNQQQINFEELTKTIENLSKQINTIKKEKFNLNKELNDYVFKNMMVNLSINEEVMKLNSKYNGYGILLIPFIGEKYKIEWVNPKIKTKLLERNKIVKKIEIQKNTKLSILLDNQSEKEELIFSPELKIDFEDLNNGLNSIMELQRRKRNMKILERLREYCTFKKETHDKANKVFNAKNLYFIIPSIMITALSGIFSFLSTSNFIQSHLAITFSIIVGVLASISTFMQSFSGAMDFGGKAEAHSVATEEYDLVLTKIKFEINNPSESLEKPFEFYESIRDKILEIKQKCKYQVPHDIIKVYSSQTVNFELGRIRDELIREAANLKAEMIKNEMESKRNFQDIELGNIKKEFDFRIIIDEA
jgi:hypothetical protein